MTEPANWGEIFADLAREYGWTFAEIANMTFDQIYLACTQGKTPKAGIPIRPGMAHEDAERISRNWRRHVGK